MSRQPGCLLCPPTSSATWKSPNRFRVKSIQRRLRTRVGYNALFISQPMALLLYCLRRRYASFTMHGWCTRERGSRSRYLDSHNVLPTGPHLPEAHTPATASVGGGGPRLLRLGHGQRSVAGEASPLSCRRRCGRPCHHCDWSHNRLSLNSGETICPLLRAGLGTLHRCPVQEARIVRPTGPLLLYLVRGMRRADCTRVEEVSAATLSSLASGWSEACRVPLPPAVHRGRSRGT